MREARLTIFNAVDASIDETSQAINAEQISAMSVTAFVTGTSTGTLNLQASNDPAGAVNNWITIPGASVSVTGAGGYIIPIVSISYEWLRIYWAHSNGQSGALTVNTKSDGY